MISWPLAESPAVSAWHGQATRQEAAGTISQQAAGSRMLRDYNACRQCCTGRNDVERLDRRKAPLQLSTSPAPSTGNGGCDILLSA
jgi:hypothetical protein